MENAQYQGIDESDNRNTARIRVSAGNKDASVAADTAIADAYCNRFSIPLDFNLLESHMPFYQSALGDRLEYEFTFNDYNSVIWVTDDTDASYNIENISLEYDMVTKPELAERLATSIPHASQSSTIASSATAKSAKTSATPFGISTSTCLPAARRVY